LNANEHSNTLRETTNDARQQVALICAKPEQNDKENLLELLQSAEPLKVGEKENPFAVAETDRSNHNFVAKKLDFSRLSNPNITLFRTSEPTEVK